MTKDKIIIGLDPDVDKIGFGVYNKNTSELSLLEFDLSDLFIKLLEYNGKYDVLVRLEAGHTVKKTWQKRTVGTVKNVARNNEIGSQIEKFLIKHSISHELVKPCGLSNYNHDKFCLVTNWNKKIKTNPEKRVAGLLAYKK